MLLIRCHPSRVHVLRKNHFRVTITIYYLSAEWGVGGEGEKQQPVERGTSSQTASSEKALALYQLKDQFVHIFTFAVLHAGVVSLTALRPPPPVPELKWWWRDGNP